MIVFIQGKNDTLNVTNVITSGISLAAGQWRWFGASGDRYSPSRFLSCF